MCHFEPERHTDTYTDPGIGEADNKHKCGGRITSTQPMKRKNKSEEDIIG